MESIDFKNESNRLATFTGWPISFIITPKSLASAGFYYTKHTDKVKCAFCNICICRWEFGDNAIDEHKRHNPNCNFVLSQECGNIPIIEGIQLREEFVENHKESGEPIDIRGLGVRAHKVAFHLKYNSYCARLKTFRGWNNESQKPEDLACAGFFFTGSNDEVRCYYCDGGLQNWELADNPWVEHAKWFPNCDFLNLVKGEKFLDLSLVERFNALLNRPRSDDTTSTSQDSQAVSIHQTDNIAPNDPGSSGRRRAEVTDQQIDELMLASPAIMALELGLQPSQVRQAIRSNMQEIGRPFRSMDSFIQQVLTQNQTFPTDGDSMTLEDILRREGPSIRTNTNQHHEGSSEESDDSDGGSDFELRSLPSSSSLEEEIILPQSLEINNLISSNNSNIHSTPEPDLGRIIISDATQPSEIKNREAEEVTSELIQPQSSKLSQSDLEEENRRLKEARLCKICLDRELGVVMLPCAHLVACITCASSLPDCPLCRQTIKATVRTFLS
ncbi:baculoviral IAP repeat-containing protein 7-like [Adelges cooleyi]|uniref:baculoviral IAP repeat-containing protein 7-like n=1 Tax=Adelges cooleyi TaxID=133065 RepID=UPI00217F9948|nr:baculoviral IAP repeat-containing protein 7-like [Adelges cooleyi]XP_050443227.1 baculoviral IAP repeat-containing protein 7-like [Adelges cooleyi]